jgi:hypothetical protein
MKNTAIAIGIFAVLLLALGMPQFALAQPIRSIADLIGFLNYLARFAFTIFLIIAVIMYIYAAYLFLTATGEEQKLRQAKLTLIWGIVAMAVAILAFSARTLIEAFLRSR